MVYRFTIISNEVEDFIREIKIDAEATFYMRPPIIRKSNRITARLYRPCIR